MAILIVVRAEEAFSLSTDQTDTVARCPVVNAKSDDLSFRLEVSRVGSCDRICGITPARHSRAHPRCGLRESDSRRRSRTETITTDCGHSAYDNAKIDILIRRRSRHRGDCDTRSKSINSRDGNGISSIVSKGSVVEAVHLCSGTRAGCECGSV